MRNNMLIKFAKGKYIKIKRVELRRTLLKPKYFPMFLWKYLYGKILRKTF